MCIESFDRPLKSSSTIPGVWNIAYKGNEFKSLPGRLGRSSSVLILTLRIYVILCSLWALAIEHTHVGLSAYDFFGERRDKA